MKEGRMRYALMIALAVVACRKTEERTNERTTTSTPPASPQSGAARTTTAPQRGAERGDESMRPDSVIPKPIAMRVADAKWMDGPPALPKGAKLMVLEGEPPFSAEKTFTLLIKLPKNYVIPPHRHLVTERITVLDGALSFGHGEKVDRAAAIPIDKGGIALVPARHPHFAFTGDRETTIALTGVGPWEIIYVNPKDDPRPTPARMPARPLESKWDVPIDAKIILANDVSFQAAPKGMYPPEVKMAVLEGDPSKPQTFVARLLFPKGMKMPVHAQAHSIRYFILSGAPKFAFGDTWDPNRLQPLDPPSVIIAPPGLRHYGRLDEDTVVQIFGVGPLEVKMESPQRAPSAP
jgi:hypothetical protein